MGLEETCGISKEPQHCEPQPGQWGHRDICWVWFHILHLSPLFLPMIIFSKVVCVSPHSMSSCSLSAAHVFRLLLTLSSFLWMFPSQCVVPAPVVHPWVPAVGCCWCWPWDAADAGCGMLLVLAVGCSWCWPRGSTHSQMRETYFEAERIN